MGVEQRLPMIDKPPARILVVDDDRAVRELIHAALEGPEMAVSLAHDGKQALSFLEWDIYQVAIIGLRLPDIDGLSLLRKLKERSPDTEALILSAQGDISTAEAQGAGACDYLLKPLRDLQLLRRTVARALERQELLLSNRYLMDELRRANRELQRQRRRELRRLEEVGLALAGALRREDVLEVLKRAISAALTCDVLALCLFTPDVGGPAWRVYSPWPLHAELLDALRQAAQQSAAEPVLVEQATANSHVTVLPADPKPAPQAFGTLVTSALSTRGTYLGLVTVGAERSDAFAPEEVQLLRILCNQAAVALENAYLFEQAQFLATRDGLTGLLNHRSFYQRLDEEISRANRYHLPLSLVILDTDCLKRLNDHYGHLTGDELLRVFAHLITSTVRKCDIVARYGGDEFAILLPHTTPEAALSLCERLRRAIESYPFKIGGVVEQLGASFGVAGYDPLVDAHGAAIVQRADEALYRAESGGRNRIEVAIVGNGDKAC